MKYFLLFICLFYVISCNNNESSDLFAIAYNPEVDITNQSKSIKIDDIIISLDVTRPIKAFDKLTFITNFYQNNKKIYVENPSIKFNMKMDMGKIHYFLKKKGDYYIAESVVIPKCITADKRWYAKVVFDYKNKRYSKIFIFNLLD